jgi:phage FluMu gp28-like protein
MEPTGDVLRVLTFNELPPSVREIPDGVDPLADGLLMAHQKEWIGDDSDFKVEEKGRRTGITYSEALDDTLIAGAKREAGGDNVYYIGDTKEKGLEFVGYCAKFARTIAEAQGTGLSGIEEFLFEDQQKDGSTKFITSYRIRFASGYQIVALSSRPANIRGLQGIVVIDEAAFHANVQAVLEAVTALLIWGGKVRIISTHNGKGNPFNQLVKDVRAGKYGEGATVHTHTFDMAVANGLYERVCLIRGWTPTLEGKQKWYDRIRARYGPRLAAMREELDAIPRDSGGQSIPGIWIEAAMPEPRPILRVQLDDNFISLTDAMRREWAERWIKGELNPHFALFDPRYQHVFGQDYARHRDFTVIAPMAIRQTLLGDVPFMVELHNVPHRQQEQILWALIDALPRFSGGAMDASGMGAVPAEYTADKYGHERIHQVQLNPAWYREWMPKFVSAFEDHAILVPKDVDVENDLRAVEDIDGIPRVPDVRTKDMKDPELFRHGDSAIALALARFAMLNRCEESFGYQAVPKPKLDDDRDNRVVRCTAGFGRGMI